MSRNNQAAANTGTDTLSARHYVSIAIPVLACLILTTGAYYQVRSSETEALKSEFAHLVTIHAGILQQTINQDVELVESLAGLLGSENVQRSEFDAFVQPVLRRHPEIQALEWIPRIKKGDRGDWEAAIEEGLPGFQITEQDGPGRIAKARLRDEYFPVLYVAPLNGNEQVLGFDLFSESDRRRVLETARDAGTVSTSSWIRLVQEPGDQYGFLVVRPVYSADGPIDTVEQRRHSLIGYALGAFRVGDLVEQSLLHQPPGKLDFRVYADQPTTANYHHPSRTRLDKDRNSLVSDTSVREEIYKRVALNLPGRQWSVLFSPAPAFYASNAQNYATVTLSFGLLIAALLGSVLISMVGRSLRTTSLTVRLKEMNANLEQEIEERSHIEQALSTSEKKYRTLIESAPEAIVAMSLESGCYVEVNHLAEELYGLTRDALLQQGPISLSPPTQPDGRPSDQAAQAYIQQAVEGGTPTFEWTHINATGQEIPCEIRLVRLPGLGSDLVRATVIDITARKQAEGLQKRLGRILDNSSNEIYVFDAESLYFIQANKGARANLGYSMQELATLTPFDIKAEFTEQQFRDKLKSLRSGNLDLLTFTTEHNRKDGTTYPVEALVHLSREENPQVFVAICQDITERMKAEQALRDSKQYNRTLFEKSTIGLVLYRENGELVDANSAFASILGRTVEETLQLNFREIMPENDDTAEVMKLESPSEADQHGPCEKECIHADGHRVPVRIAGQILEKNGEKLIWSSIEDITEHKLVRARIDHLAFHDDLTDLPNRALLQDRLRHAIDMAQRNGNGVGILFLDIDRFKTINDTLGHSVGDQLLQQIAERLVTNVRKSDTVARFGGDEFIVIAEQLGGREQTNALADKILASMEKPFHVNKVEFYVTVSIGIALYPENGADVDALLAQADMAMYQVKESGRNNFRFYSQDMAERVIQRSTMENDLRGALERNELLFHYQPIVGLRNEQVVGMEALMRWQHPRRGLVKPAEFISILEEASMIVPATRWMLGEACRQCRAISEDLHRDFSVAVNFSAHCFHEEDIAGHVLRTLNRAGIRPDQLVIEITESTLFHDPKRVRSVLEEMQAMGVRIALDDFGTGQSSLSHLRDFPIDIVKIDRDFVQDTPEDRNDCELVSAIIAMARSLNKRVIAEGVETAAQLKFLNEHNCDAVQGFLFGRPMASDKLHANLIPKSRIGVFEACL